MKKAVHDLLHRPKGDDGMEQYLPDDIVADWDVDEYFQKMGDKHIEKYVDQENTWIPPPVPDDDDFDEPEDDAFQEPEPYEPALRAFRRH